MPVYQLDLDGNTVKKWHSAREASRKLGIGFSCIWCCLNNRRKTYKNFIWVYADKINEFDIGEFSAQIKRRPRKIAQYSLDGMFIKQKNSAKAFNEDGFDGSTILKCCKNEGQTHKGYIFRFA